MGYGDGYLTVRAVKLFVDGALGSRGAALKASYCDCAGHTGLVPPSSSSPPLPPPPPPPPPPFLYRLQFTISLRCLCQQRKSMPMLRNGYHFLFFCLLLLSPLFFSPPLTDPLFLCFLSLFCSLVVLGVPSLYSCDWRFG